MHGSNLENFCLNFDYSGQASKPVSDASEAVIFYIFCFMGEQAGDEIVQEFLFMSPKLDYE